MAPARGIRILFYHRVTSDRDPLAISPQRFAQHMEHLASEGYAVVDMATVETLLDRGPDAERVVALCFDDGYKDIALNALPILSRLGFRASVFVATGITSGQARLSWYDEQPELLSWDEIVKLDCDGVFRFEPHTVTHPNLLALEDDCARTEIEVSKRALEARLGRAVTVFCYPGGFFDHRERGLVESAGFSLAASCEPGINDVGVDRLALHRTAIDGTDGLFDFRAKLAGAHDTQGTLRSRYRRVRYGQRRSSPSM